MRMRLALAIAAGLVLLIGGRTIVLHAQGPVAAVHLPTMVAVSGEAHRVLPITSTPPASGAAEGNAGTTTVLTEDFAHKVVVEWSHAQTSRTPKGGRPMLGEFGPEVVTLVLRELPQHKLLHIQFDLYAIRSWDGSNAFWGPDIWQMSLVNGPTLVRTTFNNCACVGSNEQAFPDNYPCPPHAAGTGAAEQETLGYQFDFHNFGGTTLDCDAVYHIDAWAPHEEAKIAFQFAAFYNDRCAQCAGELKGRTLADQSWGIANLKVDTAETLVKLNDAELKECWEKLAAKDPVEAIGAMWRLAAAGDSAAEFIAKSLRVGEKPADELDAWQVRRARRALEIINTPAARHALWVISEPGSPYDTHDERYAGWGMNP